MAENSFFIKGETINSPMGGNIAAFSNKDSANKYAEKFEANIINWIELGK